MLKLSTLRYVLLAIVILDIPFRVDKHYGDHEYLSELNALGGLSISLTTLCLFGLYGLWLIELAVRRSPVGTQTASASRWLLLYLAAVCVSVVAASDRVLAGYEVFLLLQTFLLYFYLIKTVHTRGDVLVIVSFLIASLLLETAAMLGLFVIGHSVQFGPIGARIDGMRIAGTAGGPNSAASFIALLLPACLALVIVGTPHWRRWLALMAFVGGGVALVLTFSRGGWLAAAVSISFFCFLTWRRSLLSSRVLLAVAVCAVLALVPFHEAIIVRVLNEEGATAEARFSLMKLAYLIVIDNPVLGVGANNYAAVMEKYVTYPDFAGVWLHTVHNKYLLVWAENGIFGLVGFVGFVLTIVCQGWYVWLRGDRWLAPLTLAFAVAVVGQMLHMNLALFHGRLQVQLLWVVAALVTASYWITRQESAESANSAGPVAPSRGIG